MIRKTQHLINPALRPIGACAGFTLVELLVIMAIFGLLALMVLPALSRSIERARVAQVMSDLRQIETALEFYYADHRVYPPVRVSCNQSDRDHWCQLPVELVEEGYLPPGHGPMSAAMEDPFNRGHTYKYAAIGPYMLNGAMQQHYFAMYVPDDFPRGQTTGGRYRDDPSAPLVWAIWSLGPRHSRDRALHPHAPVADYTWYGGTGDHGVIARLKSREGSSFPAP